MILEKLIVGPAETNCYLVGCKQTNQGLVIDPGAEADKILKLTNKKNLNIKYIINTHAHIDHIGANKYLKEMLENVQICMHEKDIKFLKDSSLNLSDFAPPGSQDEFLPFPNPDIVLHNGLQLKIGNLKADILHTPGHTPGGISIVINNSVFTGDALFSGSIGNTSFPLADYNLLIKSIKDKLLTLPDDCIVYPGHGSPTTIGKEKRENPYLL